MHSLDPVSLVLYTYRSTDLVKNLVVLGYQCQFVNRILESEYEVYRPCAHVVVYLLKKKKLRETFSKVLTG